MKLAKIATVYLILSAPVHAQDFSAGMAAYSTGDYFNALQEWRPLAHQGDDRAQYALGVLYYNGQGVPQDYAEARRWYRAAAEQGDAFSQFNLGILYTLGRGVQQDYATAHMWYNISAANGHDDGAGAREVVAEMMTSGQISEAQRRASACLESGYQYCN
jgi:uncharacterized protein